MLRINVVALALLAFGCSRQFPSTAMVAVQPDAHRVQCAADADCGSAQLCVDRMCYDVAVASACGVHAIHFATNSDAIDMGNRSELNQVAACLRSERDVRVNLAGNADERGDRDYNLDLAQRRANAIAAYLEANGVPSKRVATMTYGADNPICSAHDRDCWRQNRRVDIAAAPNPRTIKNKLTTDQDTSRGRRIDSTGNGTDNGSPVGKQ